MATKFDRIDYPELFFGFVAAAGADVTPAIKSFESYFIEKRYNVIKIKVTDLFKSLTDYIPPEFPLETDKEFERIRSYIRYGNQIRRHLDDDAALASLAIAKIADSRHSHGNKTFSKNVYLLHQFKRKEEIELLRSVYGRLFFQISTYSRRGARIDGLSRRFAKDNNKSNSNLFRSKAEEIVNTDEHEIEELHGQRVSSIFHDADFIINADIDLPSARTQVFRFCDLIFGSNSVSPTKYEYGMFIAKAAALRTLDLSRQVGAAIFSIDGEAITLGSNEVPKAGGGTYWCDDAQDDREYRRGFDSNDSRKHSLLNEVMNVIDKNKKLVNATILKELKDTQFMDALEYGRIVHAEMSAICDAARLGHSLRGSILFCTTFPCHMCSKHIVASGISKVVFLEPYPKSLTPELHGDSVRSEGADRGKYQDFKYVSFEHFYGVSPRRYRELFERSSRKDKSTGHFMQWKESEPMPIIDIKVPLYAQLESLIIRMYGQ